MKTLVLAFILLLAPAAEALTITLTEGNLILEPLFGDTLVSISDGTADHTVSILDFTLESPLLNPIPVADYLCPSNQRCHVSRLGLAVLVPGSVIIGPGTGGVVIDTGTPPATAVPEISTLPMMILGMVSLYLLSFVYVVRRRTWAVKP